MQKNSTMKWITFALTAALVFLQYQIWLHDGGLHQDYRQMQHKAQSIEKQNEYLRQQNALLRAEVNDLKNGFDAVSETARRDMGYIERGETFYRFSQD